MMHKKESQYFKLKKKLSAILKSPFSRRGGKNTRTDLDGEDGSQSSPCYEGGGGGDAGVFVASEHNNNSNNTAGTDTTSTIRASRSSLDVGVGRHGPSLVADGLDFSFGEGRSQSPAPSQARSNRHSISKATSASAEHVRVSITVDTIKQQLSDGLQILAEFKNSLRPSSDDVQRYDEAVGSFEGAAKGLATLKNKLSNRKLVGGGNGHNRNSCVLAPPDLKVEFEDTPFSLSVLGMDDSSPSPVLDVVQESKENEAQEEARDGYLQLQLQHQQQCIYI